MRLLHVSPTYLPATRYGGPIRAVHGLCKGLVANGHEVHVFTTNVDGESDSGVPLAEPVDLDGVKVWYFPSRYLRRLYWSPQMLRMLKAMASGFDLMHHHSVFLWPTWGAARIARMHNIPYVVSPHGMLVKDLIRQKSTWQKRAWIAMIETKNLEHAACVHVTAEIEKQELAAFPFSLRQVELIPNAIDVPMLPLKQPVDSPYALYLGRINWKKGLDWLIRSWKQVPELRLMVVGNDEENYWPQLRKEIDRLGLEDVVSFIGSVDGDEKWALYRNASLFILPSYSENFGITVLEAMSMECPVIVSDAAGAAEIVDTYSAGIVVPALKLNASDDQKRKAEEILATSVKGLLDHSEEAENMGRNGRNAVLDHYSWDAVSASMAELYMELVLSENAGKTSNQLGKTV